MHILTLNYEFPPLGGGAAPVSEELAANLVARGHAVDVVTMGYGDLPAQETRRGVTVYRVPALRESESMSRTHEMASYLPGGYLQARRLFGERDYDAIHAHFVLPTGALAYLLADRYDVPYYVTAHGSDVPGYNPDRFTALHRLTLPAWTRIVADADAVVSPSEHLARLIRAESDGATLEVIPNGFEHEGYDPDRTGDERILVTSRLFERKGVQHFLDALARVETDWDVVVTGDGPYREALVRKAGRLDLDVTFTGWIERDRLEELLETSEIYVFPSSHENCPVSVQEAMAAGCAVLASAYSGTAEVVGDAGVTVDPRDTRAFAAELAELLERPRKRTRLQRRAVERVSTVFDWSEIGTAYEELLSRSRASSVAPREEVPRP